MNDPLNDPPAYSAAAPAALLTPTVELPAARASVEDAPSLPEPRPARGRAKLGRLLRAELLLLLLLLLLLSLMQVLLAGYRLGVGNQAIQIPFLRHWIDPTLYARDAMVSRTLADYPSFFFRALAWFVPADGVAGAYFLLHLLATFGVLSAVYALGRAVFRSRPAGFVAVLLLLAGHHRALAGDDLYSVGFTHTWAVFPLAIFALCLFYKDRLAAAFLLAGLIFNFHALTAGYLFVMFGFWACVEVRRVGWKKAAACVGLFAVAALPTTLAMAGHRQAFGGDWVKLTQIRSADHSFPSAWWQANDADVPRFLLLTGFAVLSLGFAAPPRQVRKSLLLTAGVGLLFAAGAVFSEWMPVPVVLRAQLFRASRLLLVVAFVHAAYGIARGFALGWRAAFHGAAFQAAPTARGSRPVLGPTFAAGERTVALATPLARWSGWIELLSAAFSFLCIAAPPLLPLLPVAFLLATLTALLAGRLSWPNAAWAGGVLLVCAAAGRWIGFGLGGGESPALPPHSAAPLLALAAVASALVALPALRLRRPWRRWFRSAVAACGLVAYLGVAAYLYRTAAAPDPADRWQDVQSWARQNTKPDALFLTPAYPGGFRVGSERAVVGEWRDGTQAYFSADFASDWWRTMQALQPGMLYDATGRRVLSRGKGLGDLTDAELIELCDRMKADYLVLPAARQGAGSEDAGGPGTSPAVPPRHDLVTAYDNGAWGVYLPQKNPPPEGADPEEEARQEFIAEVVRPNIEKYRKGDARVQVVDEAGRAVYDLPYEIRQTKQAFNFGCSMAFFTHPAPEGRTSDFKPPPVTETEKQLLPEIFNFSMIPFSGKWVYVEPKEGQRHYEDMDLYTAWCREHGIGMEFHFLSGYAPAWLRAKPPAEQQKLFVAHASDLVKRYGREIKYWQVVNEDLLLSQSPAVFKAVREVAAEVAPDDQFGISHCAQFYNPAVARQYGNPLFRGLDDVRWLKSQGVKVDFFGFHGHRPFGIWPDVRQMYQALDGFAREGVKIHISEFSCPLDVPILGTVRSGRFTEDLQAEYYEFFYTVCFSHPSVEMINLWGMGPVTWQEGAGLLDEEAKPKPVFFSLKDLIRRQWTTHLEGKLPLDGVVSFRGFHGDYELILNLPAGGKARAAFPLLPGSAAQLKLKLDRAAGTLTPT